MEGRARRLLALGAFGALPLLAGHGSIALAAGARAGPAHACVFDHATLRTPTGRCRPRAKKYPPIVTGSARRAIYDSTLLFGIPYQVLLQIAECESGLNSRASSGSYFGLFQFDPGTFRQGATQLRAQTGVRARSYWNALDSAYVAGFLFAVGEAPSWSCEPPPVGQTSSRTQS